MADNDTLAEEIERNFRTNLRRFREVQGLTQADLAASLKAEGLAFHQQTIQKIERGERQPRLAEAVAIAEALGVELDELLISPDINNLALLQTHVDDAKHELWKAIARYENSQAVLAMHADALGLVPDGEDDFGLTKIVSTSAAQLLDQHHLHQEWTRHSIAEYTEFMDQVRPGEIDAEVRDEVQKGQETPGPFMRILEEARGEHTEEG